MFWLRQGERDGGADELEGAPLLAGGFGEHGHGGGGPGEADLVAGQGGQVGGQAAEAAVGAAGLVVLAGGLDALTDDSARDRTDRLTAAGVARAQLDQARQVLRSLIDALSA